MIRLTTHLECGHSVRMTIEEQDIHAALDTRSIHCRNCREERAATVRTLRTTRLRAA